MQLSNKIKTLFFIALSYLVQPLFLIINLQFYDIMEMPDNKWLLNTIYTLTILGLSYYTYLAVKDKGFKNKLKYLKFIFPALIITVEIIFSIMSIHIMLLPSIVYMALLIALFFLKEETEIKLNKTISIIVLGLVLASCSNDFDSPAGKVIKSNIKTDYLLKGGSVMSFNKLKLGEQHIALDIAKSDSVNINKLFMKYHIDDFGTVKALQLLKPGFVNLMIDSLKSMEQAEVENYERKYNSYRFANYWGNMAQVDLQISQLAIDHIRSVLPQMPIFENRYKELGGLAPDAVGVEDYYVDYTIKTYPAEVELRKYKHYQLYLPSYAIAFEEDIPAEDFPLDE